MVRGGEGAEGDGGGLMSDLLSLGSPPPLEYPRLRLRAAAAARAQITG